MPSPRFLRHEQILRTAINRMVARSPLTDVSDTSSWKFLLSAVARFGDEWYFQLGNLLDSFSIDTARGDDLDKRAQEIMGISQRRRVAAKAVGNLIFHREVQGSIVTIPAGTVVKTSSGVEFVTTALATIAADADDTATVAAIARVAGSSGNAVVGSVSKFAAVPPGVQTVTNPAAFAQGRDKETDDEFRARIRDYVASLARSTPRALEFAARSVELASGRRVVFANAVEDPISRGFVTLYIDDGAGTSEESLTISGENVTAGLSGPPADSAVGGETRLLLDHGPVKRGAGFTITSDPRGVLVEGDTFYLDESQTPAQLYFTPELDTAETIEADYTYFTGLIGEVQKVINGDKNDRTNYPGFRAAGVQVVVLTPGVLQQTVEASLVFDEGFTSTDVLVAVTNAISQYINSLGIGADVLRAELIAVIMSVPGVVNMQLLLPLTDVTILDDQIPRVIASNILLS